MGEADSESKQADGAGSDDSSVRKQFWQMENSLSAMEPGRKRQAAAIYPKKNHAPLTCFRLGNLTGTDDVYCLMLGTADT
jgi:hypothetical protein